MALELGVFYLLGIALVIVGVILIIVTIILASKGQRREGEGKGKTHAAGVIMIGPVPIIFGTDKKALKTMIVLALALTIVALIATVVFWLLR